MLLQTLTTACMHMVNLVNERLKCPSFLCNKIAQVLQRSSRIKLAPDALCLCYIAVMFNM